MKSIDLIQTAMKKAEKIRPQVGGFPYLAACLHEVGVTKNEWILPAGQSTYWTSEGVLTMLNQGLISQPTDVPSFDEAELKRILKIDQNGESSFPEFLMGCWKAGIVRYVVDFEARKVSYYGTNDEVYAESYPEINVNL
ncbi:MAG: DUF1398 domain-containing protein [Lactococcus sp.]